MGVKSGYICIKRTIIKVNTRDSAYKAAKVWDAVALKKKAIAYRCVTTENAELRMTNNNVVDEVTVQAEY